MWWQQPRAPGIVRHAPLLDTRARLAWHHRDQHALGELGGLHVAMNVPSPGKQMPHPRGEAEGSTNATVVPSQAQDEAWVQKKCLILEAKPKDLRTRR